jgi:hypothetical protein
LLPPPAPRPFPSHTLCHWLLRLRLLGELTTQVNASGNVVSARAALRLDYLPALRTLLTKPLQRDDERSVPEVRAQRSGPSARP